MGMHVMEGEFSPLYWGQVYGGAQEAWLPGSLQDFGVSRIHLNDSAGESSRSSSCGVYLLGRELSRPPGGLLAHFWAAWTLPLHLVLHLARA